MPNVIQLKKIRRDRRLSKTRGITLCKSGIHKWSIDPNKRFDVKKGSLITTRICERCGVSRTTAD
ncbi:MAG: hypothetical protein CMQ36_05965 [Gammaproteobacteria bacterium]|nr:hypothetical protein [Gammaproteobacteria bacterium]HAO55029.1 hypothetical protein [Gammaproteobacteria bacterium]